MDQVSSALVYAPGGRHQPIDWSALGGLAALHAAALCAPFYFSWFSVAACLLLYVTTASLGTSMGFHRMLTHRSLRASGWLRVTLTIIGCLAMQGRPFYWVGVHRLHHADPDGQRDPHTPRHGLGWAHWGWMVRRSPSREQTLRVVRDLLKEPAIVWVDRACLWLQLASIAVIAGIGTLAAGWGIQTSALSMVLWAVGVRTVLTYHATWWVNSAAHRWGYVNYATRDDARNLWWVGLLACGEGWHNNHHAFPRSARIGHRWFEVDITWWAIRLFEALGWVTRVHDATRPESARRGRGKAHESRRA